MATTADRGLPARHEVPLAARWDLESVFPTDDAWEAAYLAVEERLPALARCRGRLGESAATLLAGLRLADEVVEAVGRVGVYAFLRLSEDVTNARSAALADWSRGLSTRARAAGAFVEPEVAALPEATVATWLAAEPGLAAYRPAIEQIRRRREHIRSVEIEEILARASEVAATGDTVHSVLEDGELPLGSIRDAAGAEVKLAQGNLVVRHG